MKNPYIHHDDHYEILYTDKTGYERHILVDDEDFPLVDSFSLWVVLWNPYSHGYAVGTDPITKQQARMHRVLMKPGGRMVVDHINFNGLDNRRKNLRVVSQSENTLSGRSPWRYDNICTRRPPRLRSWMAQV